MTVSAYAPELLELFKTASREEVLLTFADEKNSTRIRFRLNSLLRHMRDDKTPLPTTPTPASFHTPPNAHLPRHPVTPPTLTPSRLPSPLIQSIPATSLRLVFIRE